MVIKVGIHNVVNLKIPMRGLVFCAVLVSVRIDIVTTHKYKQGIRMKQIGLTIHQCQLPDESVHACHSQQSMGPYNIAHYLLVNELSKLFRKANVLYWAKSLLNLTYDFINHCIASSFEPPPLSIP